MHPLVSLREGIFTLVRKLDTMAAYEDMGLNGRIMVRELPAMSEAEWGDMWPKLTPKERDRYSVAETKNIITLNGRFQVLSYVGSTSNNALLAFSQYFAVGTFPITTVSPSDTILGTEIQRVVPSSYTVSGNTVDVSTFYGTAQGNGTLTNCGMFGVNASATVNSGTMMTHALLNNYVKTNTQTVTFDYLFSIN